MQRIYNVPEGEAVDWAVAFAYAVSYNAFMGFCTEAKLNGLESAVHAPSRAAVEAIKSL